MREHVEEPRYVTTDDDTVYSLLSKRAARTPDDIIAEWQDDNTHQWRSATATEMLSRVREVAKGLLGLGVKAGTMVLIYSPTCYEWGVADFACAAIGAVVVPVYETDSARQTAGIVEEVDPAIAFAGDFQRAQTLEQIRVNHPGMKYVFNFKADGLDAVVDFGHGVSDETLDAAIARIKADDLLTVVYTSGSTGKPKGAMLSNRNYTHIVLNGYEILRGMLYDDNRLLLFLPLAHCFARYIQYVCIGGCGVVGYIPDAKRLLADIRSFKPTYLLGVPRVFEKVYNAASQKAGAGIQGHIFAQSVKHFVKWSKDEQAGRGHSFIERMRHSFYMATVGKSIRSALGPNLKWLACGGAPLNVDLAHFFNGMNDITFIQGYGMTETAGGKNISPAPMEDVIDTCPIVAHAVVVGDGKPFVSALIELDPEMLHSWLEGQGLNADMTLAEASDNDAVRAFIQQYIDQANANVSRAESVRKFAVLDEEFSQEHGTLTPSMKVVRPKVLQRYATVIEEDLYAPKPSNKPLPATAKIIDSTLETVKKSSESVKQASEQVKQASEQMKTSVSDSIASVSEKIKKSKAEPEEGETGDSADNAADTGSKPDQPADEKNEE